MDVGNSVNSSSEKEAMVGASRRSESSSSGSRASVVWLAKRMRTRDGFYLCSQEEHQRRSAAALLARHDGVHRKLQTEP